MNPTQGKTCILASFVKRYGPSRNAYGRYPSDDQVADIPAVHGRAIRNHRDEFVDAVDDSADTRNEPVGLRRSIVFDKGSVSPQEALVVVAVILGFWVCRRRRDDLARNYQMGRRGCCHCVFILLKFVCVCPPILD